MMPFFLFGGAWPGVDAAFDPEVAVVGVAASAGEDSVGDAVLG